VKDLRYYLNLISAALGIALIIFGIFLTTEAISSYNSISIYYSTPTGVLEAHLHPSQYAFAFDLIYFLIGMAIVSLVFGLFILLRSLRHFKKVENQNNTVYTSKSQSGEIERLKSLFELGEISREAYEMQLKKLQK
jgi:uncharacterized membrane protein